MNKGKSTGLFGISLLLWIGTISHDFLGFIALTNAQAVGFDLWTAAMWAFLGYSAVRLVRAFSRNKRHEEGASSSSVPSAGG